MPEYIRHIDDADDDRWHSIQDAIPPLLTNVLCVYTDPLNSVEMTVGYFDVRAWQFESRSANESNLIAWRKLPEYISGDEFNEAKK